MAVSSCMAEAPDYTVTVPDDMVEEQDCTEVALYHLVVGVAHTVVVVEEDHTTLSFLPLLAGQR